LAIRLRACLLVFALVALSGCGGGGPAYSPPSSIVVSLTQVPPSTVPTGTQSQIIASVANDGANMGVDWSVSCGTAKCGSFNPTHTASGIVTVFTAPASLPAGNTVNITAASTADKTKTATVTVGIVSGIGVAITQAPPASIQTGSQAVMGATVQGDSSNAGVDWTVTCGSLSCGAFDPTHTASGATTTFYAPSSVPARGNVIITATSTADNTKTAVVTLPITALISITFTQAPPATLLTTAPAAIVATVTNDAAGLGVDWVVTCGSSSCGSFGPSHTASGQPTTFTAPATLPAGNTVLITATATADRTKSASAAIAVNGIASSVSISFTQLPPVSLQTAGIGTLAAAVTDDTSGQGMDWTVNCNLANCGSFNPAHTTNGVPTTFTAPTSVPTGGTVTIMAAATADPAQMATATVAITNAGRSALIKGQYAFLIRGTDANGFYSAAGSIITDGAGNVSSGEEDLADPGLVHHATLTGTYTIGGDGSGTIKLLAGDTGIGVNGVQTFTFTVVSPQRSLLFDSSANSTGTLDLQTPANFTSSAISGGYAFAFSGVNLTNAPSTVPSVALTLGGVLTADGGGNFTNVTENINNEGTITSNTSPTGTYSAPDLFGRGTATLGSSTFVYYVVNSGALRFIETDNYGLTAGLALAQATVSSPDGSFERTLPAPRAVVAPPTFTNASMTGSYVFTLTGMSSTGSLVAGGVFTADGNGNITASDVDVNNAGTVTNGTPSGTYTIGSGGNGTLTLGTSVGGLSQFAIYATSNQGILLFGLDPDINSSGRALSQISVISASTFTGNYTASFQAANSNGQEDFVGLVVSDGISALTGNANVLQVASGGTITLTPDATLTGTFAANSNGRFTGTLNTPPTGTLQTVFYVVDTSSALFLEADGNGEGTGLLQLQQYTGGPTIALALTQPPSSSLMPGAQTTVNATVTNDSANLGVDWVASCASANCGSFNPPHTASGATTTYTAPLLSPSGGTVTLSASATADPTKTATAAVMVIAPVISIAFTSPPPTSLQTSGQAMISATVVNDLANLGVDWAVSCSGNSCGSFNPAHTASGVATTYTAPATVPSGSTVTITATAAAAPTQAATANITISAAPAPGLPQLLNGPYAFILTGTDANGFYVAAGSITADGDGNITGGEEDFVDPATSVSKASLTGTYTIGSDGRGTLSLTSSVATIGVDGAQTMSFAVVNTRHSLITEFDSSATSSGSLDLQSPAGFLQSSISGGYSFAFTGVDPTKPGSVALDRGGVLTADGAGNFINVTADVNDGGAVSANSAPGTYTGPDSFGRGTASLGSSAFVFYMVNSSTLRFVETDSNGLTAGSALAQGSGPFTNGSLSGNFAFTVAGKSATGSLVAGGLLTSDGNGNITTSGVDVNDAGAVTSGTTTGTYAVATNGRGTLTLTAGGVGGVSQFAVYLTQNQGVLMFELDAGLTSSGTAWAQSGTISASTLQGNYAADFDGQTNGEVDFVGQVVADGVSALSGKVDVNQFAGRTLTPGAALTGSFTANSNGRFPGSLDTTPTGTRQEIFYVVSNSTALFIDVDSNSEGSGLLQLQQLSGGLTISIAFTQTPPSSLGAGAQTTLSATVTNDTANLGVDWTVNCSSSSCGSFNPTHTAGGASTTFTAPASVPAGNSVNIAATSTAAPTQTASATLTILTPISVTFSISPPTSLQVSTQVTMSAAVANDAANAGVNWTVTCGSSSCGSFNPTQTASGATTTFTAPTSVPTGTSVTITATSVTDPTKSVSATVSITTSANITVTFSPAPPLTLNQGAQTTLSVTIANDTQNKGADWTVTCGGSNCGSFNPTHTASGATTTYTAPASVPPGNTVTITAASTTSPTQTASATVTIVNPNPISITLTQAPPSSLEASSQATVSATVTNDSQNKGVDWTVSCSGSSCGSFSPTHTASGVTTVFTAPASVPAGNTVTIIATSTADPTKSVSASVTIVPAITITLTEAPPSTLAPSATAVVAATVANDLQNEGVDWTVTCGGSSCGSFNPAHTASGATTIYTAPASVPTGNTVSIIAVSHADSTKTVSATVTIVAPITITFTQAPPTTLQTSAAATISATVANDQANLGVDWTVTCGGSSCGSFNPIHTASGATTTFTAPTSVPPGNTVTITATSTASPSATVSATVAITNPGLVGLLNGPYAFSIKGTDANGLYGAAGSITADGLGNITAGEEDFVDPVSPHTATLTGTYTIGTDGRGKMTLTTTDKTLGVNGAETLSFAVVTPQHASVIEFDSFATSSGSLDLQTPSNFSLSSISGPYAFLFPGFDLNLLNTIVLGGVISADGAGNFSSSANDLTDGGVVSANTFSSGTYTTPDSFGRGTATLGSSNFIYYVVNSAMLKFVEVDTNFLTVGPALAQGSTAYANSSLSGNFAFTVAGQNFVNTTPVPVVGGGLFIADGNGNLTSGTLDFNNDGVITNVQIGAGSNYTMASNGRGVLNIMTGGVAPLSQLAIYLTANQGALILELDTNLTTSGTAFAQSGGVTASTFMGNYAWNFDAATVGGEEDSVGQVVSDGVSALTGTVNTDQPSSLTLATADTLTGAFTASSNGRFGGIMTTNTTGTIQGVFYVLGCAQELFLEVDPLTQGTGLLQLQQLASGPAICLSQAPLPSLQTAAQATLEATVINDPANAGVDWSASCGGSSCGSFTPTHTASGATTVYTAPASVPSSNTVTITAASTTSANKTVTSTVTISTLPTISVVFSQAPPPSLGAGAKVKVGASVVNDSTNAGVDWSVTCGSSSCGSFSSLHTASGVLTTFTAPASVPPGNTVTITSTSTTDPTKMVSATVTITVPISIAITQAPPAFLHTSAPATVGATVTNDNLNLGVNWQLTCGQSNCGSISPTHTSSGATTTYTAPATVPANGLTVTIGAAAKANPSISATASVLVVGPVSITFSQALPTSMQTSGGAMIGATVSNDPANEGVDWTVSCGSSSCGSFSPTHTLSGVNTTYTAPATVPSGNTVKITATSTADPTKSVSGTITITSPGQVALLNGQYTFLVTGSDESGFYTATGSLKANGAGVITAGEEDYVDVNQPYPQVAITGGSYQIGPDGRGSITLVLNNTSIGQSGTQIMSISVVSSQHILITEFDTGATSSGTLDLQTTTSLASGGYSFALTGYDITPLQLLNPQVPMSLGGVMKADGAGNFTGVSMDLNDNGQVSSKNGSGTYTPTPADSFGRWTATLPVAFNSTNCPSSLAPTLTFTYYVVNSTTAQFVETDACGLSGGTAYAQGSGSFSKATVTGNYAFTLAGPTANAASSLAAGGLFTSNGSGTLTSATVDVNNAGTVTNGTPTGTYTMSANGRGKLTLSSSTGGVSTFGIYVTQSQEVLLVELDSGLTGIGAALPQSGAITSSTFQGNFAINFDSAITTNYDSTIVSGEEDAVGQVAADGVSALSAGHADMNQHFPPVNGISPPSLLAPGVGLTGAFSGNSSGRFTGTLNTSTTGTLQEIFYIVNSSTVLLLEVDANGQARGLLELQTF
jgi:predicted small lipoprotein YifL